jgi:hypothetical protein
MLPQRLLGALCCAWACHGAALGALAACAESPSITMCFPAYAITCALLHTHARPPLLGPCATSLRDCRVGGAYTRARCSRYAHMWRAAVLLGWQCMRARWCTACCAGSTPAMPAQGRPQGHACSRRDRAGSSVLCCCAVLCRAVGLWLRGFVLALVLCHHGALSRATWGWGWALRSRDPAA